MIKCDCNKANSPFASTVQFSAVHTLDQLDIDRDLDRSFAVALDRCDGDLQTNKQSDIEQQSDTEP